MIEQFGAVGVVGFVGGKFSCSTCPPFPQCDHVRFALKNQANLDYPALVEMAARGNVTHSLYQRECRSKRKIPFNGSPQYKERNRNRPHDYLEIKSDGMFHLDVEDSHCSADKCGKSLQDLPRETAIMPVISYKFFHQACG